MATILAKTKSGADAKRSRAAGRHAAKGQRLSCAFHYLLKILALPVNEFLPVVSADGKYPDVPVKRNHLFEVFGGHRPFRPKTVQALADRINAFLRNAIETHHHAGTGPELRAALRRFGFVRVSADSASVLPHDLLLVYNGQLNPYVAGNSTTESANDLHIEIIVESAESWTDLSEQEKRARLINMVKSGRFKLGRSEGSIKITLALTHEKASELLSRYRTGELDGEGVVVVRQVAAAHNWLERKITVPTQAVEIGTAETAAQFRRAWKVASITAALALPLRRLRWILSPAIRCAPLANVFAGSRGRYYATGPDRHGSRFTVDLAVCWIAWPLIALIGLFVLLSLLNLRFPVDVYLGLFSGLILGFLGAQVCSAVISPLACSAGAIIMGTGFGVAQGMILGASGPPNVDLIVHSPFISAAGGLVGLAAPDWHDHFRLHQALLLLILIASSIFIAGWLMAQPGKASQSSRNHGRKHNVVIGIAASLTGGLIGIVYGLTELLTSAGLSKVAAFGSAFVLVGGATFAVTIGLRLQRARMFEGLCLTRAQSNGRIIFLTLIHMLVSVLLIHVAFTNAGMTLGLFALAGLTAWFHATWFTSAHIIADRYGSPGSAVLATTLEGALGFVVFILVRAM